MEQFRADALPLMRRLDKYRTDHARRRRNSGFGAVRTESGMREANKLVVLQSDDQAAGVEIGFGKNVMFKRCLAQLGGAAPGERVVPDVDQPRRVRIAKTAKVNHEENPYKSRMKDEG